MSIMNIHESYYLSLDLAFSMGSICLSISFLIPEDTWSDNTAARVRLAWQGSFSTF